MSYLICNHVISSVNIYSISIKKTTLTNVIFNFLENIHEYKVLQIFYYVLYMNTKFCNIMSIKNYQFLCQL